MSIQMECPKCLEPHTLRDGLRGKTVRCKACRASFVVEGGEVGVSDEDDRPGQPLRQPTGAASRRSRFADEEDDIEDDGDDRPRSRQSQPSRSGSSGWAVAIYILLGVGGLILLVCGGAIWSFSSLARNVNQQIARNGPINNVDTAVHALAQGDMVRRKNAVSYLSSAPIDSSKQVSVIAALETMLNDSDVFARSDARKAYTRWAGEGQVPKLIEWADIDDIHQSEQRKAAIQALGRIGDKRAVATLRKAAKDFFVQNEAKQALAQMGEKP